MIEENKENIYKIILIGIIFLYVLVYLFTPSYNEELCVFSYPTACKFYCPSLDKNVTDINSNPDRVSSYIEDYKCELLDCSNESLAYSIYLCNITSSYIQEKWKIDAEKV